MKITELLNESQQGISESQKRCMQCGMTNCSCPAGSCKCKPVKGWIPGKGFQKQGVAEGSLEEVSLDLAKRARDKAEYYVDMDYDDMRDRPEGYSEKQRSKFQKYIDKKEPRAKGDRDWDPPKKGVAEEQLAELSPQTLASYKKKAGAQASELDKRAFHKDTEPEQAKRDISKANKRFSGIVRATRKEFGK